MKKERRENKRTKKIETGEKDKERTNEKERKKEKEEKGLEKNG